MRQPTALSLGFVCTILTITGLLATNAQEYAAQKGSFEGQPAWEFSNDKLELLILPQGSSLASLVMRDDPERLNPLWNPIRMERELGHAPQFNPGLGHFLCLDGFGPMSAEEQAAGMPFHGEAHLQTWDVRVARKAGNITTLAITTALPKVFERVSRTLRVADGEQVVSFETEVESLLDFDRPLLWAEHATIGSPFLEPGKTFIDMSATRAQTRPYEPAQGGLPQRYPSGKDFSWPNAPGLKGKINVRETPADFSGGHTTSLMDPARKLQFITFLNTERHLLLGYIFRSEEFPWVQNWENFPPSGKRARGLEFSTQPYDLPRRDVVQRNSMFGAPTYRWLPARSKVQARFLMFYTRVPDNFTRTDDVRLENGRVLIEDQKTKQTVTLMTSMPL